MHNCLPSRGSTLRLVHHLDRSMGFGYTPTMRKTDLTKEQREELERRKELADWLQGGFHTYADICRHRGKEWAEMGDNSAREMGKVYNHTPEQLANMFYRGSIHEKIGTQIDGYAKEFGRVLLSKDEMSDKKDDPIDFLALRCDLCGLMKSGCPAVVLVELMLACTSDYGVTIPDLLACASQLDDYLRCIVSPNYPRYPRRPRRFKGVVPLSIQFMLEGAPYYSGLCGIRRGKQSQASRIAFHLAYLYTFLKHFAYTYATEASLLGTMQYVRGRVPPLADYLRKKNQDTFTSSSLQRRVLRYFDSDPAAAAAMRDAVRGYPSVPRNERHDTLLGMYLGVC
jgi:hypothetical protein